LIARTHFVLFPDDIFVGIYDKARGISCIDGIIRNVFQNDRSGADDNIIPDGYAGHDDTAGSNEHAVSDDNIPDLRIIHEDFCTGIVRENCNVGRKCHVVADRDVP
jgi:hypothetical protein